ncbi:MAG: hypothetical protein IPN76_15100 [Saprospiraceae bacterium]|nr:hypothetical protein [Saprospiraceae bacterium]
MKSNLRTGLVLGMFLLLVGKASAQIPVTVSGTAVTSPALSASYTDLATALGDLNGVTSVPTSGTIIFTLNAGASETAPPTGLTIGSASLNPFLGSSITSVTIIKAAGAATTLNAGVGTATPASAAPDGILKLTGADHITIDGLTFTDGNATNPETMEFGVALFKRAAGDGCNNNTIQNCTFNMQRINNATGTAPMIEGAVGILVINSTATAAVTPLTPTNGGTTATNGTNSGNLFYTNTINGGNYGIGLSGFAATVGRGPSPDPATFLGDLNNDIGGTAGSTGNSILNYGGGAATNPAAGIRANNQWSINISYNTINSNDGGGVNHATTLRGIFAQAGISGNATILNNTVTVHSAGTTTACTAIDNVIGSTAAGNTILIKNNTVTGCTYTTATTATFSAILSSASAATVTMDDNTVDNNAIGEAGRANSCTFQGIYSSGTATNFNASGNTITNNTVLNQGGTLHSLRGGTSLLTWSNNTINNNGFPNHGGSLSASLYGLFDGSSPTQENFSDNQIDNLYITGNSTSTASVISGISVNTSSSSVKAFTNNTIHTLTFANSSTGSCTINGITQSLGTTVNISRNKIYGLSAQGAGSLINGINVSSGTTVNIFNNLIGDLQTPSATGLIAIRGLNFPNTGTGTSNVYYNTVYLNATSTSATTFGTSCIQFSSTATNVLNLRNNILVNTSTPAQEGSNLAANGVAACLMRTAGTTGVVPANYATTSNNNAFWCNPTAGTNNHLTYVEGTTTITNPQNTVANLKAFMVNRDQSSAQENVVFQSTTGSSNDFLKFDETISSQLESGAVNIATYTDDYAGTIREGNGGYAGSGTAPDIGAWELEGTPLDLVGPAISYTNLSNTSCTTDRTLSPVTIVDASSVNTTAGTRPRLYFRKATNANTYVDNTSATDGWKYVEATGVGGSPFSFTTNYSLLFGGAPTTGDAVEYFVVAQDLAGTPNVGINTGSFSTPATSVALIVGNFPVTGANSYTLLSAGLSGTVTIGASGTYTSLTDAGGLFAAINSSGLSGALTVNILDATVAETGANALNAIVYNGCAAGPYTVTIKPDAGVAANLTGTSGVTASALIKLNGADYVTIDGLNTGGSSLTIENTSTTSGTAVIWLASTGAGAGATNNTIANCNIKAGVAQNAATTNTYGIVVAGATLSGTFTSITAGNDNDNNTISGNTITKVRYGIHTRGGATTNANTGTVISNNTIGPAAFGTESIGRCGIVVREEDGIQITGNEIRFVGGDFANTSAGIDRVGIALATDALWTPTSVFVKNATIARNKIHDVVDERTFSGVGISLAGVDGTNPTNNVVANNFLYNIKSNGTGSDQVIGIGIANGNTDVVVFNTIYLTGDTDPDAGASTPTVSSYGLSISSTSVTNPQLANNIVYMDLTSSSAPALPHACINIPASFSWGTGSSNYNDLHILGSNTQSRTGCVGGSSGTFHATLAAWQSAVTQDANSITELPVFVSATDLHLNMGLTPTLLESKGTTIAGISTDIDGQTRPGPAGSVNGGATAPDLGADEFDGVPATPMTYVSSTTTQTNTSTVNTFSVNQEVIGIQVVVNGSASPLSATSFTLNTNGTTNTADIANAKLWYTGTSSTFATTTQVGSTVAAPSGSFNITGSQILTGGISVTNYFWLTYDVSCVATVSNVIDAECNSITVGSAQTPTVQAPSGSRTIVAGPLAGTYTVGSGGTYATLTAAAADINTKGLSGNVTLNILSNLSEPGAVVINQWGECGGSNFTLLIKPNTTATVSGSVGSGALIKLNGADRVTIDGSNSGGTDRSLTLENTNTGTSGNGVIWIASASASNGATNNTIKNCILTGNAPNTTQMGIFEGGTASISTSSSALVANSSNVYQNNQVASVQYGIFSRGVNATTLGTGLQITNNNIGTGTIAFGITGITVQFQSSALVEGNTIQNASGITTSNSGGIIILDNQNTTLSKNSIFNLSYIGTSTGKLVGIHTSSTTYDVVGNPSNLLVSNNLIYGLTSSATSTSWNTSGISNGGGYGDKYFYNSVYLSNALSGSTGTGGSSCFANGNGLTSTNADAIEVRNNVFLMEGSSTAAAPLYAHYTTRTSYSGSTLSNNSLYVSVSGAATGHLGRFNAVNYATSDLIGWQAATGETSSQNSNPSLNSPSNLAPLSGSSLIGAGTPVSVTTDFLGITRSGSTPTIGAYENAGDFSGPTIVYTALNNTCATSARTLTASITDASGVPTAGIGLPVLYWRINAGAWNAATGVHAGGSNYDFTYGSGVVAADIVQYYVVAQDNAGTPNVGAFPSAGASGFSINPPAASTPPASPSSYTILTPLGGTYNVGGGGAYATLTAAVTAYNNACLTGPVVFQLTDATYSGSETFPIIINANIDASATNTLTIRPATGIASTVSGLNDAGPLIDLSGADYVTFDGLNTGGSSLTITNTSTSSTSTVSTIRFIGGAANNTVTNCSVLGSATMSVATNGATIFFSTDAVTANGNDNNTISNNNIGPNGSNLPTKAILGNGSQSTTAIGNSGIVINNNNIYDYFGAAVTSSGVAINGGCNTWTITNNRFYQTGTRTWTTGATHRAIDLNSSSATHGVQGCTVTGNTIGYASNAQTGTYTLTGSTGKFQGIYFNGLTGATVSNINNNTVASVSLTGVTSSGTTTSSPMTGILIASGLVVTNNNTIGSQSATGSLTFSTNTTTATDVMGIYNGGSDAWAGTGNNVGGISVTNAGASGTFILYGMRTNLLTTVSSTLSSNNIGGTVANSIQLNATGISSQIIGMNSPNAAAVFTSNTIRNLTNNIGTGTSTTASVIGILTTTTTPSHTISQNTIHSLTNTNATAATVVTGIQVTGSTANVVERNVVYGLTSATTSATAAINGIRAIGGTTQYRNNMVALGAGVSNETSVTGIQDLSTGTSNYYFNTVAITGTATAGSNNSYAFNRSGTATVDIRNNIFSNTRTGGTGFHVAIANTNAAATGWAATASNYNDLHNSVPGNLAQWLGSGAGNNLTLAGWQAAQPGGSGGDANSVSIAPVFTSATDLHLPDGSNPTLFDLGTPIGGVTTDIDNEVRSGTAPDLGADEFSPITLNLTAFIEGYYLGGGNMNSVLLNSGVAGATALQCDTITVQLRNSAFPHGVAASFKGVLGTDGTLACKFPSDKIGSSYFIALRHRSAVQTWSGAGGDVPTSFSTATTSYDFSTAIDQAYGSNMVSMGGGVWALYSGDIDDVNANGFGDGEIEFQDFDVWVAENGNTGYLRGDLNGDGEVEFLDFDIWGINNGITAIVP